MLSLFIYVYAYFCKPLCSLLTGDRQVRHSYLAKKFCFVNPDCLVVGHSQGSSLHLVGKFPLKPLCSEGDSQTIGTC